MKIALVCIHYPPLRSSCAIQMRDLAFEMVKQGYEPLVVVPSEGLEKRWEKELIDGVLVIRLKAPKTIDIGYFRRAIGEIFLSFVMLYHFFYSGMRVNKIDAVVWYSPSIFFGPFVWFMKRRFRCKGYLILRDIFPEWVLDLGLIRKGAIYYLFKAVAQFQYSIANTIGVQTKSNLEYLSKWAQTPNRKLEVLNNWLSNTSVEKMSVPIVGEDLMKRKLFVYVGNMGIAQGMDFLIALAENLKKRSDIGFLFVGRGSEVERLKTYAKKKELNNTQFHDEIDPKEIPALLDMCHVGLIALDPRHKSHNIPGKFLSYIKEGLPVLARVNVGTDLVNLINKEKVGCVYDGDSIDEFCMIATNLIDNDVELKKMSKRGLFLSEQMFSSKRAVKQIVSSFSNN